jgi:branched-chain amino acid transport system permease protein
MKSKLFWLSAVLVFVLGFAFTKLTDNEFYFFAIYTILQGVIMAVAWNILGGFTGYVNFGSAFGLPLPATLIIAGIICGFLGLAAGYLTLRLKGVYFAIATLAVALVFETVVNNWTFVGGAAGTYIIPPTYSFVFDSFIELLFMLMLFLAIVATAVSRYVSSSRLGMGLTAIRDDETAAECMGVPTLKLKLISTTTMGVLMGVAGAPYPFFVSFVEPVSAFSLLIAVNAIAMPMIGGTAVWYGPVIGALILGVILETTTVTISSELNLLIVGIVLVVFITLAPRGIVGLVEDYRRKKGAPNG